MNSLTRVVIVFATSATAAVPALAQWTPGIFSRSCEIEVANVCGGSWATVGTCVKNRADRLSKRCKSEIGRHVAAKTSAPRDDEAPKPDAAPGDRPAS